MAIKHHPTRITIRRIEVIKHTGVFIWEVSYMRFDCPQYGVNERRFVLFSEYDNAARWVASGLKGDMCDWCD